MLQYPIQNGMSIGAGFGPSSGRVVEVNEPHEIRRKTLVAPMPPVVGALSVMAAFLCFVAGFTLIYEEKAALGYAALLAAFAIVGGVILWVARARAHGR